MRRALVVDPATPLRMRMAELPDPDPQTSELVIDVEHMSLNYGDLNDTTSGRIPAGAVLGADVSGTVVHAAADGLGPAVGARVVALASGGFAERVAVRHDSVAELPEDVDAAEASALPVAGLAALRSLRASGSLLGKRVLVTGAAGGVGQFTVQLAAASGAQVIASVGSPDRGAGLTEAGASHVVVGLAGVSEPVDVVIDTVGGPQLAQAWDLLAAGGALQSVGWTSGEPAVLRPYSTVGPAKTLRSYVTSGARTWRRYSD